MAARITSAARAAAAASRGLRRSFDVEQIAEALEEVFGGSIGDGASLLAELEENAATAVSGGALVFAKETMAAQSASARAAGGPLSRRGESRRTAVVEACVYSGVSSGPSGLQ